MHKNKADSKLEVESKPVFQWLRLASMNYVRSGAVAYELPDRRILIQGGSSIDYSNWNRAIYPPPEIYDFQTNSWSDGTKTANKFGIRHSRPNYKANPSFGRRYAIKTTLADGQILITGGYIPDDSVGPWEGRDHSDDTAVLVDPATSRQSSAGRLCVARHLHAAIRLANGSVILLGGEKGDSGAIADVEIGLPRNWSVEWFSPALVSYFELQMKKSVDQK